MAEQSCDLTKDGNRNKNCELLWRGSKNYGRQNIMTTYRKAAWEVEEVGNTCNAFWYRSKTYVAIGGFVLQWAVDYGTKAKIN
jgi:hypothetical protein